MKEVISTKEAHRIAMTSGDVIFNPRSVTLSWDLSPSEEADVDGSDK